MGRRSERLSKQGMLASDLAGEGDVIQVVSRAFDVLRCFEGHEARLGNLEISNRCGLPRSTVSRLTHTLTRMGQLVYLPRDQKYRIGPSAVAMSTSMMRGLQLRNLIRLRLQDVAEQLPGTVGFVIPDRFHLVYLEFARAANALGLNSTTGSRIAMASTAAGHAYTAALDADVGDALVAEMEREIPEDAKLLRPRIEANRRFLREHGYVVACGLWSPHINGLAVPIWSRNIRHSSWSRSAFCPRCMTRSGCTRKSRRGSWNWAPRSAACWKAPTENSSTTGWSEKRCR
jgi:DNA-binding IclR family transcriptional regulator